MGIRDMWSLVKACKQTCSGQELPGIGVKCIAIDAMLQIFKIFCVHWAVSIKQQQFDIDQILNNAMSGVINLDDKLKRNGVDTIWCFDGKKCSHKLATEKRCDVKDNMFEKINLIYNQLIYITKFIKTTRKEFLDSLMPIFEIDNTVVVENFSSALFDDLYDDLIRKLTYQPNIKPSFAHDIKRALNTKKIRTLQIEQISEGEKLAAILCHVGQADAVLSNDSDLIAHGAKIIIKDYKNNSFEYYRIDNICTELAFSQSKLIDFCILLGTDFNERVSRCGPVKAKTLINDPRFCIYEYEEANPDFNVNVEVTRRALTIGQADIDLVNTNTDYVSIITLPENNETITNIITLPDYANAIRLPENNNPINNETVAALTEETG